MYWISLTKQVTAIEDNIPNLLLCTTRGSESLQKRIINEGNREQACQNDNAIPACMAAATNNPNDIRGSEEGLYIVGSWAQAGPLPPHILPLQPRHCLLEAV